MEEHSIKQLIRGILVVSLSAMALGFSASPAAAAPVSQPVAAAPGPLCYVRPGGPGPAGNSWAEAYANPQQALADATCTEIWVAAGTYTPGTLRTDSFELKDGVELYGGFVGTEIIREQRNLGANPTILSGDIGVVGDASDNSFHVVAAYGTASTAVLDGFTIRDGNASGPLADEEGWGGGLFNLSGNPTLTNLTFADNQATLGGGMLNVSGSPRLTNVTFTDNQAERGGGLYLSSGGTVLDNATFANNQADYGGGLFTNNTLFLTLNHATFSGNTAVFDGHSIYAFSSFLTARNSIFWVPPFLRPLQVPTATSAFKTASCPEPASALGG